MDPPPMCRVRVTLAVLCGVVLATLAGVAPVGASDDTYFTDQWSLSQIHAPEAWGTATGSGITIGIVDTGIDSDHPDLAGKIDATATCVDGPCRDGGAEDVHGHGTLVAGIAAASTGNGRGMAGVAPDARLVVAKAVDDQGRGSVEDINNAIRWVVDRGARVVNLSLGDPNFLLVSLLGTPLRTGIDYAWSRGAVPVLASGNENVGLLDLGSANYGALNALVVGATDKSGAVASYSSPIGNAKWGLAAPGGSGGGPGADVLSTYVGGRYAWVAGTSMSAPHVAGAVALLMSRGMGAGGAVERLLATLDRGVRCGAGCQGLLNVGAAVGSGTSPGAGSPAASAAAAPSETQPAAVTTSTAPGGSSTTTTTGEADTELAAPAPVRRARLARRLEYGWPDESRNPLVVGAALVLAIGAGAATGLVFRRFRAAERW